ncbi:MAG: hypothetical protein ABIJ56_06080 [Pseudomonadota bacterium]
MIVKQKKATRLGCLWGILLPLSYTILFITVVLILPHEPMPENLSWTETIGVMIKYGALGVLSLVIYVILLIPVLIAGIVLGLRDPSIVETLKSTWPLLVALAYFILPDLVPGPVDDLIVGIIATILTPMLISNRRKKRRREREEAGKSRDVIEVELLPKAEVIDSEDRPREVIDVEFEEKS